MKDFLIRLLGGDAVLHKPEDMGPYREDTTEAEAADPAWVAFPTTVEHLQAIVGEASAQRIPITARVAGTNVGGLTIPAEGGLVLDLTRMNRIVNLDAENMVAVIEPGVTQQGLKDHLRNNNVPLTLGYSLAPPHTSVLANALLGGLTNRSLPYGDQSLWISGVEAVLADGSLVRTGAWALSDVPFARVPFPDLTGLFVGWQGTTGIVTKLAFQLWPKHPHERRLLVMTYEASATFEAVRRLCRMETCADVGALSWPSGKMMLGVPHPAPRRSEGEPLFFLYVDLAAETNEELTLKCKMLDHVIQSLRADGHRFEDPIDVATLVRVNPRLTVFAEFPMELEFLTKTKGGGLTWVGTYGPMSRIVQGVDAVTEIMVRHGVPPLIVSRPMRGGHFIVLRMITTFDKGSPEDVARVRRLNTELLECVTQLGFVIYKAPRWAWQQLASRVDPGMVQLMKAIKTTMDPGRIFNPDKLGL